eukprot:gene30628-39901_t
MQLSSGGFGLLRNSLLNKGMSFTKEEREQHKLGGLLPAGGPIPLEVKIETSMAQLRKKATPLDKYIFMHTIQDSDETLFYALLVRHTRETMPFVYTPTVGQACQEWSHIYRHTPRGLYLSLLDKGRIRETLDHYPNQNIKCLPVHIDVGTNRAELWADPAYMGLKIPRDRSAAYDDLIAEFFAACKDKFGDTVLLQFEDFGNSNAFRLLERYRHGATCFNDDIQGTAAVVLAGLISSLPLAKKSNLAEHKYLFYGAGEAGLGIAELVASAIQQQTGCSIEEARKKCWFVDSKGLLSSARTDTLDAHKVPFAHDISIVAGAPIPTLLESIKLLRPTALIGVSAQGGAFTEEVCREMALISEHPLILPLSNPTSKAECTAVDAYTWTDGKCVLFSGSPFDAVTLSDGRTILPGQGNNARPGGKEDIRAVSLHIAASVAKNIVADGRSSKFKAAAGLSHEDLLKLCKEIMYEPEY